MNLKLFEEDDNLGMCYDKDPANCEKYGRLYDWAEAIGYLGRIYESHNISKVNLGNKELKGICPNGWHLPSESEWEALYEYIGGGDNYYSHIVEKKLKTKSGWRENIKGEDYNGTDDYGFSALPSGFRFCTYIHSKLACNDEIGALGIISSWWTTTEDSDITTKTWQIRNDAIKGIFKVSLLSVRCVKNKR